MRRLPLTLAALLLVAGGCTSSGDGDDVPRASEDPADVGPSPSPTPADLPDGPDCAEVWRAGSTLPTDYETCVADGRVPSHDVTACDEGPDLIVFDDAAFARPGDEVVRPEAAPMQDGEEFSKAFTACVGG